MDEGTCTMNSQKQSAFLLEEIVRFAWAVLQFAC